MLDVYLIFVEPENVENVGSMARLCKNFGVKDFIIVNPQCNPFHEKAFVVAKHAKDILENAKILKTLDEALKLFDLNIGTTGKLARGSNVFRNPITPEELVERLKQFSGKIGLYIGRESIGFTNEELNKFDIIVTIPANPEYPILNASHAAGILLYELYKLQRNPVRKIYKLASRKQRDVIYNLISEVVKNLPTQDYRKPIIEKTLKNLINKAIITVREASVLAGFFRIINEILNE